MYQVQKKVAMKTFKEEDMFSVQMEHVCLLHPIGQRAFCM